MIQFSFYIYLQSDNIEVYNRYIKAHYIEWILKHMYSINVLRINAVNS